MRYAKELFSKDPYYCNTEIKLFSRFVRVAECQLKELDKAGIYYRTIRKLLSVNNEEKPHYNIAVNHDKRQEAMFLIDKRGTR